jgi:hypothetical protein
LANTEACERVVMRIVAVVDGDEEDVGEGKKMFVGWPKGVSDHSNKRRHWLTNNQTTIQTERR